MGNGKNKGKPSSKDKGKGSFGRGGGAGRKALRAKRGPASLSVLRTSKPDSKVSCGLVAGLRTGERVPTHLKLSGLTGLRYVELDLEGTPMNWMTSLRAMLGAGGQKHSELPCASSAYCVAEHVFGCLLPDCRCQRQVAGSMWHKQRQSEAQPLQPLSVPEPVDIWP